MYINNPILRRLAKTTIRLLGPLVSRIKRAQEYIRRTKAANIYHARTVQFEYYCYVPQKLDYQPLISIVVPVFNPSPAHFSEMVYSIINQHYVNWELILVNASSQIAARRQTAESSNIDKRIKVIEVDENKGISANTNVAIENAAGEYIAFGDHDDLFHPCALHSAVEALQPRDRPALIYTDEDKISADSRRYLNPHIKPDWSVDTLRNVNFVTHLTIIRKDMVDGAGGLRSETDGSQDYDLLLRVWDKYQPKVSHIRRILYHWRMAPGSTADVVANKQYIMAAGTKALKDHIKRSRLDAAVEHIAGKPGYYRVDYKPQEFSIIIGPTSPDRQAAAAAWIEKIIGMAKDHELAEVIIGDWYADFNKGNNSKSDIKIRLIEPEDYWHKAVAAAAQNVCVCFTAAAIPASGADLVRLAAAAADPEHTAVAPMLIDKVKNIIGPGIISVNGLPKILFEGYTYSTYTWFLDTDWVRQVDDLTTQVIAARTSDLRRLFQETDYSSAFSLCKLLGKSSSSRSNLLVWGHAAFEVLGPLRFSLQVGYQSLEPLRFLPTTNVHIYDWWKESERDES